MEWTPELIEQVVEKVLERLGGSAKRGGLPEIRMVGDVVVPGEAARRYAVTSAGERAPDSKPHAVVIGELSGAELADIACGRDDSPISGTVAEALLVGIPVYMLPQALHHRTFASTASPAYYAMLEEYVGRLEGFGVRCMSWNRILQALDGGEASEPPQTRKLVTAETARKIARCGDEILQVANNTLITPLARDILREAGVVVEREDLPC